MTKEELALEVIDRLKKEYPDAGCTLDYDQAWKLLVSVRLAAQCTDARVNVVVEDLYAKYPDVASLAKAEPEEYLFCLCYCPCLQKSSCLIYFGQCFQIRLVPSAPS